MRVEIRKEYARREIRETSLVKRETQQKYF